MGRDLERRAYRALHGTASALRDTAPGIAHAGGELALEMRRAARFIDAKLFVDRRQPPARPA